MKPYLSAIRAAVSANLPPKAVIFGDPTHTEYDRWDLLLLRAYHFAMDYSRNGIPLWWDESDDVDFSVERRTSRSKAAMDAEEKKEGGKDGKIPLGRYYIPKPITRDGSSLPSFTDWLEDQEKKKGQRKSGGGRSTKWG